MDEVDKQLKTHLKLLIIDAKTETAADELASELVNMFNMTVEETTKGTAYFIAERTGIDIETLMGDSNNPVQVH